MRSSLHAPHGGAESTAASAQIADLLTEQQIASLNSENTSTHSSPGRLPVLAFSPIRRQATSIQGSPDGAFQSLRDNVQEAAASQPLRARRSLAADLGVTQESDSGARRKSDLDATTNQESFSYSTPISDVSELPPVKSGSPAAAHLSLKISQSENIGTPVNFYRGRFSRINDSDNLGFDSPGSVATDLGSPSDLVRDVHSATLMANSLSASFVGRRPATAFSTHSSLSRDVTASVPCLAPSPATTSYNSEAVLLPFGEEVELPGQNDVQMQRDESIVFQVFAEDNGLLEAEEAENDETQYEDFGDIVQIVKKDNINMAVASAETVTIEEQGLEAKSELVAEIIEEPTHTVQVESKDESSQNSYSESANLLQQMKLKVIARAVAESEILRSAIPVSAKYLAWSRGEAIPPLSYLGSSDYQYDLSRAHKIEDQLASGNVVVVNQRMAMPSLINCAKSFQARSVTQIPRASAVLKLAESLAKQCHALPSPSFIPADGFLNAPTIDEAEIAECQQEAHHPVPQLPRGLQSAISFGVYNSFMVPAGVITQPLTCHINNVMKGEQKSVKETIKQARETWRSTAQTSLMRGLSWGFFNEAFRYLFKGTDHDKLYAAILAGSLSGLLSYPQWRHGDMLQYGYTNSKMFLPWMRETGMKKSLAGFPVMFMRGIYSDMVTNYGTAVLRNKMLDSLPHSNAAVGVVTTALASSISSLPAMVIGHPLFAIAAAQRMKPVGQEISAFEAMREIMRKAQLRPEDAGLLRVAKTIQPFYAGMLLSSVRFFIGTATHQVGIYATERAVNKASQALLGRGSIFNQPKAHVESLEVDLIEQHKGFVLG